MNEEQLRAAAERAIAQGADPALVQERLEQELEKLTVREDVQVAQDASDPRAGSSLSPAMGGLADFARMALQGATLGFADEMLGDSERVEAIRSSNPGSAFLAELAAPIPLIGKIAQSGKVGRGALVGAGVGGGTAVGEGEGTLLDRLSRAGGATAFGAGMGALLPGSAALARRRGLPSRVSSALERTSGIQRGDADRALSEIAGTRARGRGMYQAIEEAQPIINDPEIAEFLAQLRTHNDSRVGSAVGRVGEQPSLSDLQGLERRLRTLDRDRAASLDDLMQDRIPGYSDAKGVYATARRGQRAFDAGRVSLPQRSASGARGALRGLEPQGDTGRRLTARDITQMTRGMSDNDAFLFRQGQVTEVLTRITERDDQAVGLLRTLMDAGPSTQEIMRTMFPTRGSYDEFARALATERNVDQLATIARRYLPYITTGGLVGGALAN